MMRRKKQKELDVSNQWLLDEQNEDQNPHGSQKVKKKENGKRKKDKKKRRRRKKKNQEIGEGEIGEVKEDKTNKKKKKKKRKRKRKRKEEDNEVLEDNQEGKENGEEIKVEEKKEDQSKGMKKAKYDPFAHPPDLEMAETYGQAFRVRLPEKAKTIEDQRKIIKRLCPVSRLDPEAKPFPICGDMFELNFLGTGFVLLFSLLKGLIFLLFLLSLASIYKISSNLNGGFCLSSEFFDSLSSTSRVMEGLSPTTPITDKEDHNIRYFKDLEVSEWCRFSWITATSTANYGLNIDKNGRIISSIFVILVAGFFIGFYNAYVEDKNSALDAMNDVPDDFTLIVSGLPKEETAAEIHEKFEKYGAGARSKIQLKVQKVVLAYNMDNFIKIEKNVEKAKKKLLKQFSAETKKIKPGEKINEEKLSSKYQSFKKEYKKAEGLLEKEEEELISFKKPDSSKGIAFITFDTKRQMEEVKKYWGSDKGFLARVCSNKSKTKYSTNKNGKLKLYQIFAKEAPLPTDILWRNLGLDPLVLFKRRVMTFALSGLILGLCFVSVIGLKSIQVSMRKQQKEEAKSGNTVGNFRFQIISFVISALISVINTILSKSLKILTSVEKHDSITDVNRSLVVKTSITQFLNSCVMICIVHMFLVEPNFQIWAQGGILTDAMFVMLSDIYMAPTLAIIDPGNIISLMKQKSLRKQLKKGDYKGPMTQKDANKVFEGRPFDAALTYTKLLKIWFQAVFFLPVLPVSSIISTLGLFFFFWTSKFQLLRRAARPISITYQITSTTIFMLRFSLLALGLSYLIFDLILRLKIEISSIFMVVGGFLYVVVPVQYPIEIAIKSIFFNKKRVEANMDVTYENLRYKFPTEYDRANPVTKKMGMMDYANYMQRRLQKQAQKNGGKKKEGNSEQEQLEMFNKMQLGSNFGPGMQQGVGFGANPMSYGQPQFGMMMPMAPVYVTPVVMNYGYSNGYNPSPSTNYYGMMAGQNALGANNGPMPNGGMEQVPSYGQRTGVGIEGEDPNGGYYDENGEYVEGEGYYDENGEYVENGEYDENGGYYDENGEYVEGEGYYDENGDYQDQQENYENNGDQEKIPQNNDEVGKKEEEEAPKEELQQENQYENEEYAEGEGYYDENGEYVEGEEYYDENGEYVEGEGYYDENGEYIEGEGYYDENGEYHEEENGAENQASKKIQNIQDNPGGYEYNPEQEGADEWQLGKDKSFRYNQKNNKGKKPYNNFNRRR